MTLKTKKGIAARIAALVALSIFVSIIIISAILITFQVSETVTSKKEDLRSTAMVFASTIARPVRNNDRQAALQTMRAISRLPHLLHVRANDHNGKKFASLGTATFLESDLQQINQGTWAAVTKGILPIFVEIKEGGQFIGTLIIIADVSSIRTQIYWHLFVTIAAAFVASVLGLLVGIPFQRRIALPIQSLTRAMSNVITKRDYKTKLIHQAQDETGEMVSTFNKMITEIETRDQALEKLAYFDPLTGLPNRQHFQNLLSNSLKENHPTPTYAALFLLDLDEFKQINDAFGHTHGDALLTNIAAQFKAETADTIHLARLGGDEFVILATNVQSETDAQEKLAPFLARLIKPIKLLDQEVHVSTSTGAVLIPRDGKTTSTLMRRADLALYAAKRAGPGNVRFYETAMDRLMQEQTEIAQQLRFAVERNELQTHFQPQLDLKTNTIKGFEALMRWNNPERGFVPPNLFIPIAESTGQINQIGNWILNDSCKTLKSWLDAGMPPREISVNVSAAQMLQVNFIDSVLSALQQHNLPHNLLCLELTESLFIGKSVNKIRNLLVELKKHDVTIALDDFGTGYSSLSYLEKLPFDKVKIDRAFVSGIETDQKKRNVLQGIIELAHNLNMKVVAEGAEFPGELNILRAMGADWVQGYVLSKPVAAHEANPTALAIERSQRDIQKTAPPMPKPGENKTRTKQTASTP